MKQAHLHTSSPTSLAELRRGTDSGRKARIAELRAYITYATKIGNTDMRTEAERELLAIGESP